MSQSIDFVWPQGEDLRISLVYKEGSTPAQAVPANLAAGYAAKASIFTLAERNVLTSIESPSENITLGTGLNRQPNLTLFFPRALTLPGGPVASLLSTQTSFGYDIFLRNTTTNRQVKILRGKIKVERSGTVWL